MPIQNKVDLGLALIIGPPLFLLGVIGLNSYYHLFGDPGVYLQVLMAAAVILGVLTIILGVPIGMAMVLYAIIASARTTERQRMGSNRTSAAV